MEALKVKSDTAVGAPPSALTSAAMLALAPVLHGYATRRLGSKSLADDAIQDTLERAWAARDNFTPGAALKPWMFQILRNLITDGHRRNRFMVQDVDGAEAARLQTQPDQLWSLRYADMVAAIDTLRPNQRRALLLIGSGVSTVEAAAVMGCPRGTLKSHLRLGRKKLKAAGV